MLARLGGTAPVAWARIVIPAAAAIPATVPRWAWVPAGIQFGPGRLLGPAAPAEQPALPGAALVGRLGERLEDAIQAVEVGHQPTAALRDVATARRLGGPAPVCTGRICTGPVRTGPVGTAAAGTAAPAATMFFRFRLDGAGNDPARVRPSLTTRIGRLRGLACRADGKRAARGLSRRTAPPSTVPAARHRRGRPMTSDIPPGRRSTAPGTIRSTRPHRDGTAPGGSIPSGRPRRPEPTSRCVRPGRLARATAGSIPAGRPRRRWAAPRPAGIRLARHPSRSGRTAGPRTSQACVRLPVPPAGPTAGTRTGWPG